MSGSDRLHRTVLLLIGIVMLGGGLGGLFAGSGVFGRKIEHQHLYASHAAHFIGRNGIWLWPVAALVSIALAALALLWLKAQSTSPKARAVIIPSTVKQGRTAVEASALTTAITREIESYRGVRSAQARLIGDAQNPHLQVFVTVETKVRLAEVRRRIENEAIAHARTATAPVALPTSLDFDVTTKTSARV